MAYGNIEIGDKVRESPMGPGTITGATERGFPRVNEVAVAWLVTEEGLIFDPYNQRANHARTN